MDDAVDALFEEVFDTVVRRTDPDDSAERANYLVWAAHNLERTADRTTNICERVIFTVTGELIETRDLLKRST
jgi:phosphate transport system protein